MQNRLNKIIFIMPLFVLMLALAPLESAGGTPNSTHPLDDSVLLMFSSHMRLSWEVESGALSTGRLFDLSLQAASGNEIDALIQLYSDMITKLRTSDDYDLDLETRLVQELEDKVAALHQRAADLAAARQRRGRSRGFLGFMNRVFKSGGRLLGKLVGGAMEGAGKVAEFAIEDVAPQVLKEAIQNGAPLNAALVRRVARDLLIDRVSEAISRNQMKRAERLAAGETLDPTIQVAGDTDIAGLMDLESVSETEEAYDASGDGGDGGSNVNGSSVGVVVYDFIANDAFNFSDTGGWIGRFAWADSWGKQANGDFCNFSYLEADQGTVHLEFDPKAMTVSGWVEGNGQETGYYLQGGQKFSVSGSYRVTFSGLPVVRDDNDAINGVKVRFAGTGSGAGSISGSVTCEHHTEDSNEFSTYPVSDQATNSNPVPVKVILYLPGFTTGGHVMTMSVTSVPGVEPVDGFSYNFNYAFDQPIEIQVP